MNYFVVNRNGRYTIYGPFPDRISAAKAGYFYKSSQERDIAAAQADGYTFLREGANEYTPEEIKTFSTYPEEYEMKSFKVLPPQRIPVHPSWKSFPEAFRSELRDGDFDAWWRR